jgi:hypothetical protein
MPKKRTLKRVGKGDRRKILAEMKARGLTADQVAKKYRVSKWTIYGWKKRAGKGKRGARRMRRSSANTKGIAASAVRSEIRAALPGILRQEIARAIAGVFGTRRPARRRGRAGKK